MYRVLLVDDDPHLQAANRAYLEREGYEILCAFNGEEALRLASTARLNAIVLDVDMPGPDGVTVCRRLREVSSVPILFLSAYAETDDRIRGLLAGGGRFHRKAVFPHGAGAAPAAPYPAGGKSGRQQGYAALRDAHDRSGSARGAQ